MRTDFGFILVTALLALFSQGCGIDPEKDQSQVYEDRLRQDTRSLEGLASCSGDVVIGAESDASCAEDGPALDSGAYVALLRADQMAECHGQGFVYDRRIEGCGWADLAASWTCDRPSILVAFGTAAIAVDEALNVSLGPDGFPQGGQGFTIDQCGEYPDGRAFLSLLKLTSQQGLAMIRVRVITTAVASPSPPPQ